VTTELDFSELDGRRRVEAANGHVGLKTYAPQENGNPRPRTWCFQYWNASDRKTEDYPAESLLIERLFVLFGRPGAEE
jgi:hypothetical protein